MSTEAGRTLRETRDATIDALCDGFAREVISMAELERRLEVARAARTREELNRLLADLRPASPPAATAARNPGQAGRQIARKGTDVPTEAPSRKTTSSSGSMAIAVMGGTRRAGRWKPPEEMAAVALMGGVELDFTDAVLEPGVTVINCFAFWGAVEITVPSNVRVETRGFAFMGGFDEEAAEQVRPGPAAPTLRINAFAFMGGIEINVAGRTQPPEEQQ